MGLSDVYRDQDKAYTLATAAYRFAVVSKVCGIGDIDEVNTLSRTDLLAVKGKPMTETLERLLLLYGAGIIDFTVVEELLKINSDISCVLAQAEDFLIEQMQYYEKIRMSEDKIRDIIRCSAKSRLYAEKNAISFDEAKTIASLDIAKIVNGFVKIPDYELLKLLVLNGEPFGYLSDGRELYVETNNTDNILGNPDVRDGNIESEDYPFMVNPRRIIYYDKVVKLLYGADFLEHCVKYNIDIDDNITSQYERYIRNIKCGFTVNCCHRKRRICGEKVNQFDYFTNIRNEAISFDKSEKIDVKPVSEKTDEELMKMALDEFCTKYPVGEETVLEVHNQGKISLYVIKDSAYIPLDKEEFRKALFEYDVIWGKIQAYATKHSIKAVNGKVEIPMELIREFDDKDKAYAQNIITEQYSRQTENKGGRVFTTLSDLMAKAADEIAIKRSQAKLRAERGSGVEE